MVVPGQPGGLLAGTREHPRQGLTLVGQVPRAGDIHAAYLEEAEGPLHQAPVGGQGGKEARAQAGAHVLLVSVQGVEHPQRPGVRGGDSSLLQPLQVGQGVGDDLLHAGGGQGVSHPVLQVCHGLRLVVGDGGGEHGGGDVIVAHGAGHLFHQVVLYVYVAAPVGHGHFESIGTQALSPEAQGAQDLLHLLHREVHTQHLAEALQG